MAVTLTIEQLEARINSGLLDTDANAPNEEITGILATVTAMVEAWAEDAPDAVQNEAVIRLAGWLIDRPAAATHVEIGEAQEEYSPGGYNGMLYSGAASLLSQWCDPRAAGGTT